MDELVKSLFGYLQYMVIGAITLAVLGYFLAVFHPIRRVLFGYVGGLRRFWLGNEVNSDFARWVQIAVAIGALYYLGIITINASYFLVEPERFAILETLYIKSSDGCAPSARGDQASEVGYFHSLWLPLARGSVKGYANGCYLKDESTVDARGKDQPLRGELDEALTFLRVLRGTALIAFSAAVLSVIKLLIVLVTSWRWTTNESWYKNLIDEDNTLLKQLEHHGGTIEKRRRFVAKRYVVAPETLILTLGVILYGVAIVSYRNAEFEYSRMVRDGAQELRIMALEPAKKEENTVRATLEKE